MSEAVDMCGAASLRDVAVVGAGPAGNDGARPRRTIGDVIATSRLVPGGLARTLLDEEGRYVLRSHTSKVTAIWY